MDKKILGYPVKIESQKYTRNAYYFNLCFVVEANRRTVGFEPIVRKLSEYLILMEHESSFLSKQKDKLQEFLSRILHDLNNKGFSQIIQDNMTIFLKLISAPDDPPRVFDHLVPHIRSPEFHEIPLENWDLTTQQILPHINGISHVGKIALKANVNGALAKTCIRNLVYYGVLGLLPLLKYSNVYNCTRDLQKLSKNSQFAASCRQYVAASDDERLPRLSKILQFYAQMHRGVSLKALCQRLNPREHNIDERRLVTFGLQHKLIVIINKYPIFTGKNPPVGRQIYYTGVMSVDEICCLAKLSPDVIDEDIQKDPNMTVIWR